ncbi:MAG: retropepsin-like aspartic protease [Holophaga sp.]|nr:retropepsin-like aspartic protease [Holophaga sp.]
MGPGFRFAVLFCVIGLCLLGQTVPAVPIEVSPGSRVVIPVQALHSDGKPRTLRMLLDTGATTCVLDRRAAEGLVVGPSKPLEVTGFAPGSRMAFQFTFRALSLGNRTQGNVPVLVLDMARSNRWSDEPVDGFLGMSFLEGTAFTLDPQAKTFRWGIAAPEVHWFPLLQHFRDVRPYVRMDAGEGLEEALLDTGAGGTLYGVKIPLGTDCELAGGLTGARPIGIGRRRIEVFGEAFEGTRVCSGGRQLILGAVFLCAGTTVFDFEKRRLGLSKDSVGRLQRAPANSGEVFFPIAWNRKGPVPFLEVAELAACSRWHQAGFREGDRVLEVEGGTDSSLTLNRLNAQIMNGYPLTWILQRGKQRFSLISPTEKEIQWFQRP